MNHKDLVVWNKSMDLIEEVYKLTMKFPKDEVYGLTMQIKRSAISIPSNIAEGSKRGSRKDYRHFLLNAYGSAAELETQVEIAKRLQFSGDYTKVENLLVEILRMLNTLSNKLQD